MTQAEVAKKLGVGQAAVSRLESREDMLLSTCSRHFATAVGSGVGFSSSRHIWAFAQAVVPGRLRIQRTVRRDPARPRSLLPLP
ncbi:MULTISPECIES: helix-turn-helix domain-containing protein [Protofrankia]|uniref:helix-turn-helix domain-containing protein n=1 Tax=Protofrankia TaxID=2994361 RepID=UPI0019D07223